MTHHIILIPGFFGFSNIGELSYFTHVEDILRDQYQRRGLAVKVHSIDTFPTASLRKRAGRLADAVAACEVEPGDAIHLVGHSTGGLDARLFCTPGASLRTAHELEPLQERVASIVTVATPHRGTPLASLFTSVLGQRILQVLSLLVLHGVRLGSVPLPAVVALAGIVPGRLRFDGPVMSILDSVYGKVLKDFDPERQQQVNEFFKGSIKEQALLLQLSPEGVDLLNAASSVREGIRRGSVVIQARPPGYKTALRLGLSPSSQAMYALFRGLYELTASGLAGTSRSWRPGQREALVESFGELPRDIANDTVCPTLGQVWGEVVHAAWADHLDVIGHFHAPEHTPPHVDLLTSRSDFDRAAFEALWSDVAAFQLDAESAS